MSKKSVKKNYLYNLIYEILVVLVPLITTPYISSVLGPDGIGIYSYTNSIVTYFTLIAALGTTVYARREIAYVQDDINLRSKIFWEIFILRGIMTSISCTIYIIYIINSKYKLIALIQTAYILGVCLDITWFFQGMEEFGKIVIRNSIIKILNVAFIFLFVKNTEDVWIYVLGLAVIPLLGYISIWFYLPKYIKLQPFSTLSPKNHIKGTFSLFIPTIASQVYLMLDKTMIGLITDSQSENGFYEQAQKVIKICWTFVTTFATVMTPKVALAFAKNNNSQINRYMKESFRAVWFLSCPISFGMLAIAHNLVPWFFGNGFEKVEILLVIFSLIIFPVGISSVTGSQYLVVTKKQTIYTISVFIGAGINFILNLFLIYFYGSIGAAIASVLAEFAITITQSIYILKKSEDVSLKDMFYKAGNYFIAGFVMLIAVKVVSAFVGCSMVDTIVLISVGTISYFAVLLIFKDEVVVSLLSKFRNKFKRM